MAYKPRILDTADGGTGSANTPTAGKALIGNGSAFVTSTASFPATAGSTGTILRSDGTNWVATTSTYPDTNAISTLVYASAANVLSALSTANNGLLVTSSTGVPSVLAGPGATGRVLQSNAAAAPSFSTATFPSTATGTGTILRADGTNWVATTSTYPNTNAVSTLLYASATNVMAALATGNNGLLVTGNTGVPSILAGPGAAGKVLQSNTSAAPSFSTPTYPSASGSSRKMLVADGTNNVYSTETWAVPGTAANLLTSDGTNWTSTAPVQATSFNAYCSANITDVTGDGTGYTIIFNTESFDVGNNFNTTTGTYTFPVTGKYQLNVNVGVGGILVGHTQLLIQISVSGTIYQLLNVSPFPISVGGDLVFCGSLTVQASASDTAFVIAYATGGTKVVDLKGGINVSHFSGFRVS